VSIGTNQDRLCVVTVSLTTLSPPLCGMRVLPPNTVVTVIPSQDWVTVGSTVEDSVLRTEMSDLESQEEDTPKRILLLKPMS
jgi:hypothetical protein